jgi:hypothetical protein
MVDRRLHGGLIRVEARGDFAGRQGIDTSKQYGAPPRM